MKAPLTGGEPTVFSCKLPEPILPKCMTFEKVI